MGERWSITLCPFLHFDNARTHSFEHNVSIVSWNVKSVLDYLDVSPIHKFCIDQVTLLEGFRRLFPNYWDVLNQKVLEGRLEVVGGTYVMPDLIIPDGESIIRQFQYGIDFIKQELGVLTKTGWAIDSAGHCAQMPQILRQCGIDTYFVSKGVPFKSPSEFVWRGPDGSRVNTIWLKSGFDKAAWLSESKREAFSKLLELIDEAGKDTVSHNIILPVGGELVPPPMHLADIVKQWNESFPDNHAGIGTPFDFSERLKAVQSELPILAGPLDSGRFSGIVTGGLSSRSHLKQSNRRLETLLYLVELYLSMAGDNTRNQDLDNLWRMLLFNQDHNILRGTITDEPYTLAMRRYSNGINLAEDILEDTICKVAASLGTKEDTRSFVVFNPLPWIRSDVVRFLVQNPEDDLILSDENGNEIPFQRVAESDEIVFIASSVPSLGYKIFSVKPTEQTNEFDTGLKCGSNWIESNNYVVELDAFSGALTRLFDKSLQKEFLTGPGTYYRMEPDVGDLYRFASSSLSDEDSILSSLRIPAKVRVVESGPVRVVLEVSSTLSSSLINQRVTLYNSLHRIDIEIGLEYQDKHSRLQFRIPVPIYTNEVTTGSQFYAQKRCVRLDMQSSDEDHGYGALPVLDWIDCSGPEFGIGISTVGLHSFSYVDAEISATLLRSVSKLSHGIDDQVISSKTAEEIGSHRFRISLLPHEKDWSDGKVHRRSAEHRYPLMAYPIESCTLGSNSVPNSIMTIEGTELELSCFKPTENPSEFIVRLYEMYGESGMTTLHFQREVVTAYLVDLLENEIGELSSSSNRVQIPVDPHSIVTLRVKLLDS